MNKLGFTMTEVLITLGIIGVVAAMTLPALINNQRNKALETALKKNYSAILQALDMYQAETGERISTESVGRHEVKTALMTYMKVLVDCGYGVATEGEACMPNDTSNPDSQKYKNFTGTSTINLNFFDDGQFVLNDGSFILIENSNKTSGNNDGHIYISVDVNGYLKNPNRLGRDLFIFVLDSKGILLPMGAPGTKYYSETEEYCSATSSNNMNGAGCTYKALTDKSYFKSFN